MGRGLLAAAGALLLAACGSANGGGSSPASTDPAGLSSACSAMTTSQSLVQHMQDNTATSAEIEQGFGNVETSWDDAATQATAEGQGSLADTYHRAAVAAGHAKVAQSNGDYNGVTAAMGELSTAIKALPASVACH